MYCERCGNQDALLFKKIKKGTYCLNCQRFGRFYIDNHESKKLTSGEVADYNYHLNYDLTLRQQECAKEIVKEVKDKDVLVYAVCGAGKTEMIMPLISDCLMRKSKIGIAIPRKDVVIELTARFQSAYPKLKVASVYGDHHEELDGDLIIMTTHQLYRYEKSFDVLVVDEVDAFPFANNAILNHFVSFASERVVYLTATPSKELMERVSKKELALVKLFARPHGGKLCVPKIEIGLRWYLVIRLLYLIKYYEQAHKPVLVFFPQIEMVERFYLLMKPFFAKLVAITSQSKEREAINQGIKEGKYQIILATTVLERGITISNVQVIIFDASSPIYSKASLIQMAGRVGRDKDYKEGDCIMLSKETAEELEAVVLEIKELNNESMFNV